jgi:hypothetical protein
VARTAIIFAARIEPSAIVLAGTEASTGDLQSDERSESEAIASLCPSSKAPCLTLIYAVCCNHFNFLSDPQAMFSELKPQ